MIIINDSGLNILVSMYVKFGRREDDAELQINRRYGTAFFCTESGNFFCEKIIQGYAFEIAYMCYNFIKMLIKIIPWSRSPPEKALSWSTNFLS
jgi:hypothetical protein